MKQKTLAQDKEFQAFMKELAEAKKDPKFRKSLKEFIRLSLQSGHS